MYLLLVPPKKVLLWDSKLPNSSVLFPQRPSPARLPRYAGTGHAGRHNTSQGDALVHLEACGKARQDFVMNRDIGKNLTIRDK